MLNYLLTALSRALSFTKTEVKGTIVLIFIILCSIIFMKWKINTYKSNVNLTQDSTALAWIEEVKASYELKKQEEFKFVKENYLPPKEKFSRPFKKSTKKPDPKPTPKAEKIVIADLNTASADELQRVKGIGPAYSERIVKYRDLLGGFADTTQLNEVYGLKPEIIEELGKHFQIQSGIVSIPINSDSIKILAKHPYISYDLARTIINYRSQHGDIQSPEDLKKIKAIDERTFLRLKPYLE